jgi:hypothetical protein
MAVLRVLSGGVPIGNYTAKFEGIEEVPANLERKFGDGIRWKFTIDTGPHEGQTASRVTGPAPTTKNACGKMLAGVIGRALVENELIDTNTYVGKRFMIVVQAGPEGGSRIEAVAAMGS